MLVMPRHRCAISRGRQQELRRWLAPGHSAMSQESNVHSQKDSYRPRQAHSITCEHKIAAGALRAIVIAASLAVTPVARASDFGVEINGTYRVTTDGGWAQVNDVYKDEPTIVETWTMSSSCVSPVECEGTAVSSGGWTARVWYGFPNFYWVVDRNIPQWQFCPDGTTAPGEQRFQFAGFDPIATERIMTITNFMIGRQRTISPSGSCGRNQPLVIETPLKLEQLS
jgi:hypothetical protein